MDKKYYSNFRDARMVQLIKVEVNEGEGSLDDPIGRVAYFINPNTGEVLFKQGDTRERQFAGDDEMKKL